MLIIVSLLMENKYLKVLTFQLDFAYKVYLMDLVIVSLEKYV